MTNEEYIQWIPLIKKVAWKYRNNIFKIELDDLEQIAAIGLMKAFETYDDSLETSFKTWAYNSAEWTIIREFKNLNREKRQANYKTISFNTPIGDDIYLEDILSDNGECIRMIEEALVIKAYKKEIDLCIYEKLHNCVTKVCLFTDLSMNRIGSMYSISKEKVRQIKEKSYKTLREKSPMIRAKYLEYIEQREEKYIRNMYSNPEHIIMSKITSERIKNKYKKEINILNFIQEIFDFLDEYYYDNEIIKKFYLKQLGSILTERDVDLLNQYTFKRHDLETLLSNGYDIYEIFDNKRTVKRKIIQNKELAYEIWREYIEEY